MIMGKVLWIYGLDDDEDDKIELKNIDDVFKVDQQQVRLETASN
jgi:hypothetical protein